MNNRPWFTFAGDFTAPPPPMYTPKLLPGDVQMMLDHFGGIIANGQTTGAQRDLFGAVCSRLRGEQRKLPPSAPRLIAPWLKAIAEKRLEDIASGIVPLLEGVYANGDANGTGELRDAMQALTKALEGWLTGAADASAAAAGSSSLDYIEWVEPDAGRFYVPYGESGAALQEALEDLRAIAVHAARGAEPPSRLFFVGPPGCGKTVAAAWVASQLGKTLAVVKLAGLVSKWIGETAAHLKSAAVAAQTRGAVLLLDEIDSIGGQRARGIGDGSDDHTVKVVSAANQIFDDAPPDQIIIGATNLPDMVDPSIVRRIARGARVTFGNPDRAARETMVRSYWKTAPHEGEALDAIVARTEGHSGDYVRRVAMAANRRAGRRGADVQITSADVVFAIGQMGREATMKSDGSPSGLVLAGR